MATLVDINQTEQHKMTTLVKSIRNINSKRKLVGWEPKATSSRLDASDEVKTVLRRLCLLKDLEIQVAQWVGTGRSDQENTYIRESLMTNICDEDRHYRTMVVLESYVDSAPTDEERLQASTIKDQWASLPQTFASAYCLEMGVFFSILPWMSRTGNIFVSQLSNWISDDEAAHVRIHLLLAKELNQKLTSDHLKAVNSTLDFLFKPMGEKTIDSLKKRAYDRLTTGKDEQMVKESQLPTPAFFEQQTRLDVKY